LFMCIIGRVRDKSAVCAINRHLLAIHFSKKPTCT